MKRWLHRRLRKLENERRRIRLQPPTSNLQPPNWGFTLIEIMLVIIIIGALAAMVVPRLAGRSEEARRQIAASDIKGNLSLALRLYEVDNGRYPTTEQGVQALITKPTSPPLPANWHGPYLEQEPMDPWKQAYLYRYPGTHPPLDYDLYSIGPDGKESDDDITNWQQKEERK